MRWCNDVHVLVVDDEPSVRLLVQRVLARAGARVQAASSADAALEALHQGGFDVMVTDVRMPGRSGVWLLNAAKHRWPELPVIVMSGMVGEETSEAAIMEHAFAFLSKPFENSDLVDLIDRALTRSST